jgi:hypothetical protein
LRKRHIHQAVRRFQIGIDAYSDLERNLAQARRSVAGLAEHFPALAGTDRLFEKAARSLDLIGAAMADVPGLAEELDSEQQRLGRLKALAERHGIDVRYDLS